MKFKTVLGNQFLFFFDKAKLNLILITDIPKKRITILQILLIEILPSHIRNNPIARLNNDHKTLTNGDDKPFPGGFAKGVGNSLPETPLTKCGIVLVKKNASLFHIICRSKPFKEKKFFFKGSPSWFFCFF